MTENNEEIHIFEQEADHLKEDEWSMANDESQQASVYDRFLRYMNE